VSRKIWQPWYNGASFVCAFFPITTTTVTLKFWRGMERFSIFCEIFWREIEEFSIFWRKFLARNERIFIFLAAKIPKLEKMKSSVNNLTAGVAQQ
jgi:hypothetical protein